MSNEPNPAASVAALKEAKVQNNSLVVLNTLTDNYENYPLSDIPGERTSIVQYQKPTYSAELTLTGCCLN